MARSTDPHMSKPALRVQGLGVQVQARAILESVSLEAGSGAFVGLLGPNGAGKTTLLRAMSGFLRPSSGSASFGGQNVHALSAQELAQRIARIPQNTNLDFAFTAREVVLMGRHARIGRFGMESKRDEEAALAALITMGVESLADRTVDTLSGGERQLVLVARALAQEPQLLLLDEPTANLDIANQLQVMDLVASLVSQGVIAVAAVHDLSVAAAYCSHVALLSRGNVVAQGPTEQVLTPETIERVFKVQAAVQRSTRTGKLTVTVERALPQGVRT